jgi:hypothetical protein
MADKKNIVIKVKYPSHEKVTAKKNVSSPQNITEWNVKRIVITLVGIASVLMAIFLITHQNTESDQPVPAAPPINAKPPEEPKTDAQNHVTRALLTFKVVNNEPADEITFPLTISKKGSTWIYYFVELKAMKGKTVFHEWLLNDLLISRKKVNVADDIWRTSSRQVFKYTAETTWTARLVDEAGEVINEKHFNVVYK